MDDDEVRFSWFDLGECGSGSPGLFIMTQSGGGVHVINLTERVTEKTADERPPVYGSSSWGMASQWANFCALIEGWHVRR